MSQPLRVIFDLDDTLYPERAFARSGFRAAGAWAREQWGIDGIAQQMQVLLDQGHLGRVFSMALQSHRPQHSDDDLAQFIDVYRRHQPDVELFDDAIAALDYCQQFGPLGLITDGTDWVQRNKVHALGIAERFQSIIYTGALGGRDFHKPHPLSFEMTERALAHPGSLFVYVGDNPAKDFVVPNARGWASIQVKRDVVGNDRSIHDADVSVDGGAAQHTIGSLAELKPLLDALAGQG